MRRQWTRKRPVEFVHQAVELLGIWKPIAAAFVGADEFLQFLDRGRLEGGGIGAGYAEPGELAGFSQVEEMPPGFAAGELISLQRGISRMHAFKLRRVGQ